MSSSEGTEAAAKGRLKARVSRRRSTNYQDSKARALRFPCYRAVTKGSGQLGECDGLDLEFCTAVQCRHAAGRLGGAVPRKILAINLVHSRQSAVFGEIDIRRHYFVAGEIVTTRTLIGTALVLFSVVLILRKEKLS